MLYDYECKKCEHKVVDVKQSIHDDALTLCPHCGEHALERIIYGGVHIRVKSINTVGALGESNWKKMGHYKRSEIEADLKAKRDAKEKTHFGDPNVTKSQINKMTPEQKTHYIITGETP